jgi:D-psicose/D-tagatose/L-ribulose 3-epimerase
MDISMHTWMRPEPIDVTLERLAACGYDGVEIMGEPRRFSIPAVKAKLAALGLKCYGAVTVTLAGRDIIHADPYLREMTVRYMNEVCDMVDALGGTIITLVPSEVGKVVPMADPDTEWAWAIESIRAVADYASRYPNMRLGIEPLNRFETNFINRHDQALKLMEDVGRANVGVVLDAFHLHIEEKDMFQAILNAGRHLVDFHVADNNRRPCGDGSIDWPRVIATLKQAGYTGPIAAEFVVPPDRSPLAAREAEDTTATETERKFIRDHGSDLISDATYTRYTQACIDHLRASGA